MNRAVLGAIAIVLTINLTLFFTLISIVQPE